MIDPPTTPRRPVGRPPLPADEVRAYRISVALTAEELALLDARRGEQSRADYMRRIVLMTDAEE